MSEPESSNASTGFVFAIEIVNGTSGRGLNKWEAIRLGLNLEENSELRCPLAQSDLFRFLTRFVRQN